jgi:hypothetical protein
MTRTTAILATSAASAIAITSLVAVAPAAAAKGDQIKKRGDCSSSSDWAVKVKTKKGQLRTDFWVKNNTVGQAWDFSLTQGGEPVTSSTRVTRANDDSSSDDSRHTAEVKFRSWAALGSEPLVFTATSGGETCTVTVG